MTWGGSLAVRGDGAIKSAADTSTLYRLAAPSTASCAVAGIRPIVRQY
jgi:hypothetical protein